jgi:hypothetical protein
MKARWCLVAVPLLLLATPFASASGGHYIPQTGDRFYYTETVQLAGGTGNYTGYTESTYLNGSLGVTAVAPNGTESASYASTGTFSNSTMGPVPLSSSGTFTFSATTFHYVQGSDNQTGYSNPYVWFYMDNTLATGDSFSLLNTAMTVTSTSASYALPSTPGKYVEAIAATGSSSFQRDDIYGVFTASYTWTAYFDPSTGYIIGYQYSEQDTNPQGDGFTISDVLFVTSTTYALTPASAPSGSSGGSSTILTYLLVGMVVVIVVVVIAALALHARSRRGTPLPRHSAGGFVGYGPPPTAAPPPINLIPAQQPPVQQVVLRETVKVACRYCGALIDSTATVCPVCGAPRT